MMWTTKAFGACNHPSVPKLAHADNLKVNSGQQFYLNADRTIDPDGDSMSYWWFQYPEAASFEGIISFKPYLPNLYSLPVTAPVVDSEKTIHFILKVADEGTPALTTYKRVVVPVTPQ